MATSRNLDGLWREAFGEEERPSIYSSAKPQSSDFAVLTSPRKFIKDLEPLSNDQLYALSENCQLALQTAQDEYFHIEQLIRNLDQKDSPIKPGSLIDSDRFEEEKEAILYAYKRIPRGLPYTRTKDGTEFYGFQEPFSQGGFVPTDAQYKRIKANARDSNNTDDWTPIERDGKKLIPRMPRSPPPRQRGFTGTLTRPSRKSRLVEQGLSETDATMVLSDSDAFDTPRKRATRFLGLKVPQTRDPSETPRSARASPTPIRQHRFIMNNLSSALISTTTANGHSAIPTPAPGEHSPTPPPSKKRRRMNSHKRRLNPNPDSNHPSAMPPDFEAKKWTDASLLSAINEDHSFLHPDPAIALAWKTAILNAPNPVRSYAMKRKWAWWKDSGMDKRPRRGWKGDDGDEEDSQADEGRSRAKTKAGNTSDPPPKKEADEEPAHDDLVGEVRPALARRSNMVTNMSESKQAIAKQQQKDGQFTFKLAHPPPPLPPPTSSPWTANDQGRPLVQKIEGLSPQLQLILTQPAKAPPK